MKKLLLPCFILSSYLSANSYLTKTIEWAKKNPNISLGATCLLGAYGSYKVAQYSFNNPTEDSIGFFIAGSVSTTVLGVGAAYHLGYKTLEQVIKSKPE
jgi:hypothetical protein